MIRPRLFTITSVLSLLLCVVTVLLSVRSYSHFDQLIRRTPLDANSQRQFMVATRRGLVYFGVGISKGAITDQRSGSGR